jgi:hypothetical protein
MHAAVAGHGYPGAFWLLPAVIEKLRAQLVSMKKAGGDEPFKTSAGTMLKYIGNVARAPDEDKFRCGKQ